MPKQDAPSTRKGRATRDRIVAAAADLMYRHGVAGTSTPAVRSAAGVSSSQIYHYFADKDDLTRAVIAFQTDANLAFHAPFLARLDSLDALRAWRDVMVDDAARQQHGAGGCPLGSLCSELSDDHPWARDALAASFTAWSEAIRAGLAAMTGNGTLPAGDRPGPACPRTPRRRGGRTAPRPGPAHHRCPRSRPGHRDRAHPRPRSNPARR